MKKYILIVIGVLLLNLAEAQQPDSILAKSFRLDFAIPDQPAFNVLGHEPSDILRPSTLNELSLAISNFYNGKNVTLPQSFGMEIAPFLFINNKATLKQYADNRLWYNLRFSVGTGVDTTSYWKDKRTASIGFRWTPIDEGDIRTSKALIAALENKGNNLVMAYQDLKAGIARRYKVRIDQIENNPKAYAEFQKDSADCHDYFNKSIETIKTDFKQSQWNRRKLDFASALLISSADSVLKKATIRTFAAWASYAQPLGKKGLLIIGATYKHTFLDSIYANPDITSKDSTLSQIVQRKVFNIGARVYVGANRIKGFTEVGYKRYFDQKTNSVLFNIGVEVNVYQGFWVDFKAALDASKADKQKWVKTWYPSLNIKWQIPEKFKLF